MLTKLLILFIMLCFLTICRPNKKWKNYISQAGELKH